MAIDDNTLYGLTGAQVKELPGKIEAVKGLAKELTADDYNWPVDNPRKIALWLLNDGVYSFRNLMVYSTQSSYTYSGLAIVKKATIASGTGDGQVLCMPDGAIPRFYYNLLTDGSGGTQIDVPRTANNLTTVISGYALDARQGKVLKNLIDAIVVPTKTSDLTNDSSFVTSTEMTTALASKADANAVPTALSDLTNDINAVSDSNYVHTDNNYTTTEKTKLAGIASGAEANVQSDWNQTDTTADDYIKNKPTIPSISGKLDNTTTFWGQTASNGAVNGDIVFDGNLSTAGKGIEVINNGIVLWGGTATMELSGTNLNDTVADFTMAQLKNVANGSEATDAVNLRQLNSAIAGVSVPDTFTTNEWNALWA